MFCVEACDWWIRFLWHLLMTLILVFCQFHMFWLLSMFYVDEILSHSYGNSVFYRVLGVFEACLSSHSSKLIWLLLLIIIFLNSMSNIYFCLHRCLNIRLRFIFFVCKCARINTHKLVKLDASRKTWIDFKWILN